MKKIVTVLLLGFCALAIHAQELDFNNERIKPFKNLDLSLTVGAVGIGFDFSSPINNTLAIRSGFYFMPKIKPTMSFGLSLENEDVSDGNMNSQSRFDKMAELFSDFTGCEIDDKIDMKGEPTFYNFSLLLDVFPFKDKRWHFTAGIYAGPSRVAKAYNTTEDMPSLFSVNLYNKMYESAYNDEPLFTYGDHTIFVDPEIAEELIESGRMNINLGRKTNGDGYYRMEPNSQSMIKVKMKVNAVRPYLGFGYGSNMIHNRKSKYNFSFDAGVMFWGGTPQIVTHDGTNLAKDVKNIKGKVGDYVDFMSSLKVFPVVNFRISRTLF